LDAAVDLGEFLFGGGRMRKTTLERYRGGHEIKKVECVRTNGMK
jgi:hypothetical protein